MDKPRPLLVSMVLLTLFVVLLWARLPFINNVLMDEEGMFAYMAVDNGDGAKLTPENALLLGRLDGRTQLGFPSHPVIPYLVFVDGVRRINSPRDFTRLDLSEKSRIARRPFLAEFVMAMALVFFLAKWIVRGTHNRVLTIGLLLFACSMPLLVGGSIQPQLDGSWGVLLCATAAVLMLTAAQVTGLLSEILSLMAGFTSALGKNEWWLALIAAAGGAFAIRFLVRRDEPVKITSARTTVALMVGVLAGCAVSWWSDPANFVGGFAVIERFGRPSTGAWKHVFSMRWTWIWPVAALTTIASGIVAYARTGVLSGSLLRLTALLWGLTLFAGFFATSWSGDGFPRYFCPVAIVILSFLIDALRFLRLPTLAQVALTGLLLAGTVKNERVLRDSFRRGISISSLPGIDMSRVTTRYLDEYERFARNHEAAITDAAYGYYFPNADFAVQSMGVEEARKALERWKEANR